MCCPAVEPPEVETKTFADELYLGTCTIEYAAAAPTPRRIMMAIRIQLFCRIRK
jgi:hypothetical protein